MPSKNVYFRGYFPTSSVFAKLITFFAKNIFFVITCSCLIYFAKTHIFTKIFAKMRKLIFLAQLCSRFITWKVGSDSGSVFPYRHQNDANPQHWSCQTKTSDVRQLRKGPAREPVNG